MFAIEVEFLLGRAAISSRDDRTEAEWPPHPQRLFSGLVAAHVEVDGSPAGEAALRWLECLAAPEIRADLQPSRRTSPSYFVPVNDEAVKVEKGRVDFRHVLDRRNRQERFFPAIVPEDPTVVFQWRDAPGIEKHREALKRLVENVTYLGHSASPVRACLRHECINPSLCPSDEGEVSLRIPSAGRLDRLMSVHQIRIENESVQPPLGRVQRYAVPGTEVQGVFSGNAVVLAFDSGPKLGLDSTLPLMQHVRSALLARIGTASPEIVSGHDVNGNASRDPHLAFVPLPFVNSRYADGSIKGVALILPRAANGGERRLLHKALGSPWSLQLGPLGAIDVRMVDPERDEIGSLNFDTFSQSANIWASITPVVLDRFPKKSGLTAEAIVSAACNRIGLPVPSEVRIGPVSAIAGAPPVRDFHGRAKQVDNRMRQHVLFKFDRPIRGPVLLGAGRFMGLGFCVPYKAKRK